MNGRLLSGAAASFRILALILFFTPTVGAQPFPRLSQVKVVAVAPFADGVGMHDQLTRWTAVRLTELLPQPALAVVSFEQTERAAREMGASPAALIAPAAAAELGRRVGADAVVSGRLIRADVDRGEVIFAPFLPTPLRDDPPEAFVVFEPRLVSVVTRQVLVRTEAAGREMGAFALQRAAERVVRDFVRLLTTN